MPGFAVQVENLLQACRQFAYFTCLQLAPQCLHGEMLRRTSGTANLLYQSFTFEEELKMASSNQGSGRKGSGGTRGGTPEQHAEAGRQSHKNDGKSTGGSGTSGGSSGGTRGGTPEQHAEAGRQSHKNDNKK
jgi:hypothetical protein